MCENWVSYFSRLGSGLLKKSLPGKSRISELSISQGLFSNPLLSLIPENSELFRTDFPMQNYTDLGKSVFPFHTYLVPGSIYKQLHASNSLDLTYAFQVFNHLSRLIPAHDHLLSTLTKDSEVKKQLSLQQNLDLSYLLNLRHKELAPNGDLIFDILVYPEDSEDPYSWDCLDLAVQMNFDIFPMSERKRINLHPCFRTKAEVLDVLHKFDQKFQISDIEEHEAVMPSYQEFLIKGDVEKYSKELIEFWKYPITVMVMRAFRGKLTSEEVLKNVEKIMGNFKKICADMQPKSIQKIIFFRLTKL